MPEKHYRVRVQGDHLKKLANARPIQAVAELIWNAADADATRIDFEVESDDIAMRSVTVRDDGHGIPHEDVESLFGKLGGSWKAYGSRSKTKGRMLHGKEGKGRFKAFALGRVVDWTVRYRREGKLVGYKISMLRDDLVDIRVTEPQEVDETLGAGTEVRITELDRDYRSLDQKAAVQALSQIFALYLTDYSDVDVCVDGERLDPSKLIASKEKIALPEIEYEGEVYSAELEVIEWTEATERWVFLCGKDGFPFQRVTPNFHSAGFKFSAYLKSSFIDLLQEQGLLDLAEMNPVLESAYEEVSEFIKRHFREREVTIAQTEIEQWKADEVYPYRSEPQTKVEQAERQVFDIVALNVNKHLKEFSEQSKQTKAFQLRMLRQAIERGPDELQHILTEVLELPERTQKEMSRLLREADLANVIGASKLVSDRLKVLNGIESLLFDPEHKKLLKERSQLHRMISDGNTWLFGEEFSLALSDRSLTAVLRKHRNIIGKSTIIDEAVKRIDGKVGVVDLMLSKAIPQSHDDEFEHLIVELKRPSVKIGADEIAQVKKYAFTIADDERFRHLKVRWSFWVVSNDLDSFAKADTRQKDKPRGQVYESDNGSVKVWVKTWAEVLAECRARMKFVQDRLQANVDKESSLAYLKKTYEKYLLGVAEVNVEEELEDEDTVG